MDFKIEVIFIGVSDVDRAKAFYVDGCGFPADYDETVDTDLRFVQITPPGSACSIAFGRGLTELEPGAIKGVMMVVADVAAAREQLVDNGVEVSEVDVQAWGSFVTFSDPDGNSWTLQQLPSRG